MLLDQAVVAGIGNIYADESLPHARIHPARRAGSLSPAETRHLARSAAQRSQPPPQTSAAHERSALIQRSGTGHSRRSSTST